MLRVAVVTSLATILSMTALAQRCGFGGQQNAEHTEKLLRAAATCSISAKLYNDCRWGSSADVGFAAIVIEKCKAELPKPLTPTQQSRIDAEHELCVQQFGGPGRGTLALSDSVSCDVDMLVRFVNNPHLLDMAIARASFDCSKAQSPYERTVCANPELGRDDFALSLAYKPFFNALKGAERQALIQSQREWHLRLPVMCGLSSEPASGKVIACLHNELIERSRTLAGCSEGLDVACVDAKNNP